MDTHLPENRAPASTTGTLERRRQQLLKLILADPPASRQAVVDLASSASWDVPETVAVIALQYRADQHQLPASTLGSDVLLDLESSQPCIVVADPATHVRPLQKELSGRLAAVGPVVPLADAPRSHACARRTLELAQRGILPSDPIIWCRDHFSTLALLSDEFVVGQLAERALAPFDSVTKKQRERLLSTLLAWLETGGGNEIGARLEIHPQTVRYRMHQVDQLFGDRLGDADERLTLLIALRADRLLTAELPLPARDASGTSDFSDSGANLQEIPRVSAG